MAAAIAGHRSDILRFVWKMVGRRAEAEDLTQTVLLEALRSAERYQGTAPLVAWMRGIAVNVVRASIRRNRVHLPLDDDLLGTIPDRTDTESTVANRLELQRVAQALGTLPEEYREAVIAVCLEGMRYDEAAAALGVPIGTVRSRVARGRALLLDAVRGGKAAAP
jgi:RNA polymerase sigma-70 factor (ECF subfamily)